MKQTYIGNYDYVFFTNFKDINMNYLKECFGESLQDYKRLFVCSNENFNINTIMKYEFVDKNDIVIQALYENNKLEFI